jgi:hypothetical protein
MKQKTPNDYERVNEALRQRGIEDPMQLLALVDTFDEQATVTRDNLLAAAVMGLCANGPVIIGLVGRDACDIVETVMAERKKRWSV